MLRHFRMTLFATLVVLALTTPGPGSAAAPTEESGSRPTSEQGDYRIGPEDVLDIAVWNNTAISRTVPVRPDGKISLPLLNDVQAAGLTSSRSWPSTRPHLKSRSLFGKSTASRSP